MKFLTVDTVRQLAQSARLRIALGFEHQYEEKINAVLDYAAALMQAVPLEAVKNPQDIRPVQPLILRSDNIVQSDADLLLQAAPAREDRFFVVPVVISQ